MFLFVRKILLNTIEKFQGFVDSHAGNLDNIFSGHRYAQDFLFQARAVTSRARLDAHIALYFLADIIGVGFAIASFQIRYHAFKIGLVSSVNGDGIFAAAVQNDLQMLFIDILNRLTQGKTVLKGERGQNFVIPAYSSRVFSTRPYRPLT